MILCLDACRSGHKAAVKSEQVNNQVPTQTTNDWSRLEIELGPNDNANLYRELKSWLGTPYQYAGNTRSGVDCSGLVVQVFRTVYGKQLERNSARIFERNCRKIAQEDLREGDLVFFITNGGERINHVGIYLKEGKFVHASSHGVRVDDLLQRYYATHFEAAGRLK